MLKWCENGGLGCRSMEDALTRASLTLSPVQGPAISLMYSNPRSGFPTRRVADKCHRVERPMVHLDPFSLSEKDGAMQLMGKTQRSRARVGTCGLDRIVH